MFNLFYKYSHHFYLPSIVYNSIIESYNGLSSSTLSEFLLKKGILVIEKQISLQGSNTYAKLVNIKFKKEEEKNSLIDFLKQHKELFPPWKVFPDMFQGSPRWNQGIEEDYSVNNWLPFWKGLDNNQRNSYMKKYSCPLEWKSWLLENEKLL